MLNRTSNLTLLFTSLCLHSAVIQADVLYDNFGPGDAYDEGIGWLIGGNDEIQLGAGFVVPAGNDFTLVSVTASIRNNFSTPNTVTLVIYDTVDGLPGSALEAATVTDLPPHDGTPAPPTVFEFSGKTLLEEGQTYWVIANAEPGGNLAWNWNVDHALGLHAQMFGDGPWQVFNFEQAVVRVEGTVADVGTCPADLTGDGSVGVPDLLTLLAAWGEAPGHAADLNGDGVVGVPDLLELLAQWGEC